MGCCYSSHHRSHEADTSVDTLSQVFEIDLSESDLSTTGPLPYSILLQVTRSICYLQYDGTKRTPGVAVSISDDKDIIYHGVITHNISFNDNPLSLHYPTNTVSKAINPIHTYTCPVLNLTFIQLQDELVQYLKQQECYFFSLLKNESTIDKETSLYFVGEPTHTTVKYTCGRSKEYYGQDLLYYIDTKCSCIVPGLPVVTLTGQLVALHKGIQTNQEYIGVSMRTISSALHKLCPLTSTSIHITSNPFNTNSYEGKLEENGLDVIPFSEDCRYKKCTMYISPASPFVTPIWFMPTYLGWYWTPTDPNGQEYPNWMSVDRLEVIGGYWHRQIPAPKNVTIIRWLSQHNISTKF